MTMGADGKPADGRKERTLAAWPRGLLREYDKAKLELAGLVRDVKAQTGGDEYVRSECEKLLARQAQSAADPSSGIACLATSSLVCNACQAQASAEEDALSKLSCELSGAGSHEPLNIPLLCLPHFRALLSRIADLGLARKLMEGQAAVCERVSENMQRAVLKHEARRRALQSEEEIRAHLQGLMIVAGHRRVAVTF
jgi:hypothetical protein